jgi:RNA polymerase sigma-70 factor, ECF subfamily
MPEVSPDREILLIAQTDKRQAFELAFNRFWEPLYVHAYRKVQSQDNAKDLVQEVFAALWKDLDKLAGKEHLQPYLFAVLRNKILGLFEKDEVRLRHAVLLASKDEASEPSSLHLLLHQELHAIIDEEVEKMPPRMKEIYLLNKHRSFSIKAIADKLLLSEQTVKNQLQHASQRLKSRLKKYNAC